MSEVKIKTYEHFATVDGEEVTIPLELQRRVEKILRKQCEEAADAVFLNGVSKESTTFRAKVERPAGVTTNPLA